MRSVLVIGIGNPMRGDDGVGARVVERLRAMEVTAELCVASGEMTELLDLWQGRDTVVMVDAVVSGGAPGHVHRLDLVESLPPQSRGASSTHGLGLGQAVAMAKALGDLPRVMPFFGIEAGSLAHGEALSPPVAQAAERVATSIFRQFAAPTMEPKNA